MKQLLVMFNHTGSSQISLKRLLKGKHIVLRTYCINVSELCYSFSFFQSCRVPTEREGQIWLLWIILCSYVSFASSRTVHNYSWVERVQFLKSNSKWSDNVILISFTSGTIYVRHAHMTVRVTLVLAILLIIFDTKGFSPSCWFVISCRWRLLLECVSHHVWLHTWCDVNLHDYQPLEMPVLLLTRTDTDTLTHTVGP